MEDWHEYRNDVSLSTRLIAFLWDYVIISCYLFLLFGISFFARPLLNPLFTSSSFSAEITGFVLITMPVYLYFAISEGLKLHATWGKRKMGIVVESVRGQPIGLGRSLFRSALKFAPWELAHFTIWHIVIPSKYPDYLISLLLMTVYVLIFIYLISHLKSKNKQTVYDLIAGTVVRYK
ncbi:RDD family protein [Neobacillus drentensis]|uniref:RDD family protein n=1 Tax=Neobacillus drentensis TaxID=220684 RepID=UPI00285F8B0E|nr:RDD family protein [Neobacillus drentensis]MDR7238157.1 putative RDD family membrane protein YckC [Neobacillus drentensis]